MTIQRTLASVLLCGIFALAGSLAMVGCGSDSESATTPASTSEQGDASGSAEESGISETDSEMGSMMDQATEGVETRDRDCG
jgi:hypothetical protein